MPAPATPRAGIISSLVKLGADPLERNQNGVTLLMLAAASCADADRLKVLLGCGIDVNAADIWGRTALMYAADTNPEKGALSVLLECGADIDARDDTGKTALMYAAQRTGGSGEFTAELLAAGAGTLIKDISGRGYADYLRENRHARKKQVSLFDSGV